MESFGWRFFAGPNKGRWPLWLRRAFLLTAPLSFPLYAAILGLTMLTGILLALLLDMTASPAEWARKTWKAD